MSDLDQRGIGRSREDAEAELHVTSDRLRIIQRVVRLGFWDWNIQTGDLFWSEEIYPLFGLDPEEFGATYEAFMQAVHPDDRKLVQLAVDAAVNDGATYDIEHRLVQPDGTVLYVNEQGEVTRNAAGEPLRMLGTVINITDRVLADQARREREAEFQALWEASHDGMVTVDFDGQITLVNRAAERMFGFAPAELVGQPIEILVPKHLREVHIHYREQYQRSPYSRSMGTGLELEASHKDGSGIQVEISLTPIEMRGRREVLVEVQDVSNRRALEERLRQSDKLKAIGQLTGGIAHDLNNILTAILGFTELSQMKLEPEHESTGHLRQVLKAGERAKTMVSEMLAFTRQQVLQPQLLDLTDTIKDLEKMLQQLIREDVELLLKLDAKLGRVHADPEQLEKVIVNLVVNASDAMPDGGKLIIATHNVELDEEYSTAHALPHPGLYVELSVSDTGTGILPAVRDKIFDPFFTTKERGKGTGLGLSTVYGIVKQSKGEVTVYSEAGKGSTFKIYLPATASGAITHEAPSNDQAPTPGSGNILLVEDDEGVRHLAKRILESNGYTVQDFGSGEEALSAINDLEAIDLVLTDIVLTGMSGLDLEKSLKKSHPSMAVLFMSGYAGRALESTDFVKNDATFISKPFSRKALLQRVSRLLQ